MVTGHRKLKTRTYLLISTRGEVTGPLKRLMADRIHVWTVYDESDETNVASPGRATAFLDWAYTEREDQAARVIRGYRFDRTAF